MRITLTSSEVLSISPAAVGQGESGGGRENILQKMQWRFELKIAYFSFLDQILPWQNTHPWIGARITCFIANLYNQMYFKSKSPVSGPTSTHILDCLYCFLDYYIKTLLSKCILKSLQLCINKSKTFWSIIKFCYTLMAGV